MVQLSAREGDLLAHMSAAVLQRVPEEFTPISSFPDTDRATVRRLVKKGLLDERESKVRINAQGVERAKSVY